MNWGVFDLVGTIVATAVGAGWIQGMRRASEELEELWSNAFISGLSIGLVLAILVYLRTPMTLMVIALITVYGLARHYTFKGALS